MCRSLNFAEGFCLLHTGSEVYIESQIYTYISINVPLQAADTLSINKLLLEFLGLLVFSCCMM